jgi:hypothetical protein
MLGAIYVVDHKSGGGPDRGPAVNPVHGSTVDRSKGVRPDLMRAVDLTICDQGRA